MIVGLRNSLAKNNSAKPDDRQNSQGSSSASGMQEHMHRGANEDDTPRYSYKDIQKMLFENEDLWNKIAEKRAELTKRSKSAPSRDATHHRGFTSNSAGNEKDLIVVASPSDTTVYTQAIKKKATNPIPLNKPDGASGSGDGNMTFNSSTSNESNQSNSFSDETSSSETDSFSSDDSNRHRRRAKRRIRDKRQ